MFSTCFDSQFHTAFNFSTNWKYYIIREIDNILLSFAYLKDQETLSNADFKRRSNRAWTMDVTAVNDFSKMSTPWILSRPELIYDNAGSAVI